MNYLAHAYLSFMHEEILVGNMISDHVKGKRKFEYPPAVQKGIHLHRLIDRFTDDHALTREAKQYFKPSVGLYAGAFTDIVYDHFLATGPQHWQEQTLPQLATYTYNSLEKHQSILPPRFRDMFPYMKSQDWLYGYRLREGIGRSFEGLARRAVYLDNATAAFDAFNEHYDVLEQLSQAFIADVKKYATRQFQEILTA